MTLASSNRLLLRTLATLTLFVILATTTVTRASAPEQDAQDRSKGARCLFAGHSFFCPVALNFDRIARKSDFPEHEMKLVFRGGQSGTAGALWVSPKAREEIEAVLATGDIELFGLTPGLTDTAETFQRWFDLALEHNPDTRFFIGIPWAIGGHGMATDRFDKVIDGYAHLAQSVVEELRERYPDNRIDYLAYGKVAPAMKRRFEADNLADIDAIVGTGPGALFIDNRLGHAGPMLLELCALTWMKQLYAADLDSLTYGEHESDVSAIIEEVMTFHDRAGSTPEPSAPESPDAKTNGTKADDED
jgi:hypothetical protein